MITIGVANQQLLRNTKPAFKTSPILSGTENAVYSNHALAVDNEGATITITATTLPSWLTLSVKNANGSVLTGTPLTANIGENPVVLKVSDGRRSSTQSFSIVVAAASTSPVFTKPSYNATENVAYSYAVTVTDPNNATLTITATTLPASGWLTFVDNGGGSATLSGTPLNADLGANTVVLSASNGTDVVTQAFTLTVRIASEAAAFEQPLLSLNDLTYAGAFKIPKTTYGVSSASSSDGVISVDSGTIYLTSHPNGKAVAQWTIPTLVNSTDVNALNEVGTPLQGFDYALNNSETGNTQNLDIITGLAVIDGKLLLNAAEVYDGSGGNTHTTLVFSDASDIAGSTVTGFLQFPGATKSAGWISPVPTEWQTHVDGTYITGYSSGISILSRLSVGPSAHAFYPADVFAATIGSPSIPTRKLLEYSLENPLSYDLRNVSLNNDLWTHMSKARYGFIVPGTRTYATFGSNMGMESSIGYKTNRIDTNQYVDGYTPYYSSDSANYYWFYNLNDLIAVKNGDISPSSVRPYSYGEIPTPFQLNPTANIVDGGSYDATTGKLYLTVSKAYSQGLEHSPVIIAYDVQTVNTITNDIPASITGYGYAGHVLTAVAGTWTGGSPTGQWHADAVAIPGATLLTYSVAREYHGAAFTYVETVETTSQASNEIHLWTLDDLPATEFWISRAASNYTAVSNKVSQANDMSGYARNAVQTDNAKRPFDNDLMLGRDAFGFPDIAEWFGITGVPTTGILNYFAVSEHNATTHFSIFGALGNSGTYIPRAVYQDTATTIMYIGGVANPSGAKTLLNGELVQSVVTRGNVFDAIYDTPSVYGAVNCPAITNATTMLGGMTAGSPLKGPLTEAAIISGTLTDAELNKISAYLAYANGVALVAGHAYINGPPSVT